MLERWTPITYSLPAWSSQVIDIGWGFGHNLGGKVCGGSLWILGNTAVGGTAQKRGRQGTCLTSPPYRDCRHRCADQ